jgi:thioredoxin reductase
VSNSSLIDSPGAVFYDVAIVGGGPAGLSAALVLGRSRLRVLVCDSGQYRNAASGGLHGFLTRDCVKPAEFLRIAREQLEPYSVELRRVEIVDAGPCPQGFELSAADGQRFSARKLLLATGVADQVPAIPGMREMWGSSVFQCPYCDGWEMRDQPLAAYGRGQKGFGLALALKTWTSDVILCTDGRSGMKPEQLAELHRHDIPVFEQRMERLEGKDAVLENIVFRNGESVSRRGIFLNTGQYQRSLLAARLGCGFNQKGTVHATRRQESNVPGVYVAGDAAHDAQFVIVAAAEGAKAALAIHAALQAERRESSKRSSAPV